VRQLKLFLHRFWEFRENGTSFWDTKSKMKSKNSSLSSTKRKEVMSLLFCAECFPSQDGKLRLLCFGSFIWLKCGGRFLLAEKS
jgi:hypothetical protein